MTRRALLFLSFTLLAAALPVGAQEPSQAKSAYISVIGAVQSVDPAAHSITVKTDKGDQAVKYDDRTQFLQLPPGETDVRKATAIKPADVSQGDHLLARVRASDPNLPALRCFVNKKEAIAQRNERTLEEWQTQSISGLVESVDPAAKTITLRVRGAGAGAQPHDVKIDASGKVGFERYSAETGKYEPSDFGAIAQGNVLRVLGQKNADATEVKAEAIQSGAFRTIPALIKSVNGDVISAVDPETKKPITITIKNYTTMKRLDDTTANMLARRLNPTFQQGGGRGRGFGRGTGSPEGGAPGMMAGMQGAGGGGFGGRGGARMDMSKLLDQQPSITVSDLKPNEPVIITGINGSDASRITAITLIAGVDPILRAAPNRGPDPLGGSWNFGDIGGGEAQ
jgi:Cu/Ag efflux protein CusF